VPLRFSAQFQNSPVLLNLQFFSAFWRSADENPRAKARFAAGSQAPG
jgi:hypothetical protein